MSGPIQYPRNILTEAIEANKRDNVTGVAPRPVVGLPSGGPTVRSADLGTVVPVLPPLTGEEKAAADMALAALGIDPATGNPVEADPNEPHYATEAEMAAELLEAAERQVNKVSMTGRIDTTRPNINESRMSAREFMGPRMTPVLPDFKAVTAVNFVDHQMHVGGMAFPMEEAFEAKLRRMVIEAVVAEVQARLMLALAAEVPVAESEGAPAADQTL